MGVEDLTWHHTPASSLTGPTGSWSVARAPSEESLSAVVVEVESFAFASLGVKGLWDAQDAVWILRSCVRFDPGGGRNRTSVGANKEQRKGWGGIERKRARGMGNINKASKKNSKRKKVRKNSTAFS